MSPRASTQRSEHAISEVQQLLDRIHDDALATSEDCRHADDLADSALADNSESADRHLVALRALLAEVEGREPFQRPRTDRSEQAGPQWAFLSSELASAEERWNRLATVQARFGIIWTPLVTIGVLVAVAGGADVDNGAVSAFLLGLIGTSLGASYLTLRVHQQARLAQERLVEKRVAVAFLEVAYTAQLDSESGQALLSAGTAMFLGHYAPPGTALSPDDLAVATRGLVRP